MICHTLRADRIIRQLSRLGQTPTFRERLAYHAVESKAGKRSHQDHRQMRPPRRHPLLSNNPNGDRCMKNAIFKIKQHCPCMPAPLFPLAYNPIQLDLPPALCNDV